MNAAQARPEIRPVSVIIPAHNEEATIGRLLRALAEGGSAGALDIVVVCNGCSDATAQAAREALPDVRVVEIPTPSKAAALKAGDEQASGFPRVYVDADVVVDASSVRRMTEQLRAPGVLACAPERQLDRDGASRIVRWYYDVWERLPQVREGLFGRGVIMVNDEGFQRIRSLPPSMSDDLVMSEAFLAYERRVVRDATVVIRTPRTTGDLLRRRIRVATGNRQAEDSGLRGDSARTSLTGLLRLAAADRVVATRLPVFLAVGTIARLRAARRVRSGDYTTWLRDESSRS